MLFRATRLARFTLTIAAFAAVASPASALVVERAEISEGRLIIEGIAKRAGQMIFLEGTSLKAKADREKKFTISASFRPDDCRVTLREAGVQKSFLVADCGPVGERGPTGLPGPRGATGATGQRGPQGDPGGSFVSANITSNGVLRAGVQVTSTVRNGTGNYTVTFSRDISVCSVTGMVGGGGEGQMATFGVVRGTFINNGDTTMSIVVRQSDTQNLVDSNFMLVGICPPS